MKNKTINFSILLLAVICFLMGIVKISPMVSAGYEMYKTATEAISVPDRIEELKQQKSYITFEEIPEDYKAQVLQSEDKRFYYHFGFDPIATARAMANNVIAGSFVQGGSTITQQLAKNMYFSFEKKYERKVAELFVSFQLEKDLTKDEILELYCNIAYYGEGCYGLKQAANHYYGVEPLELTNTQIKSLVWTIKSPNRYNPNAYKAIPV
ncbi:biosynthetic peptidoglycan transglycosylase [Lacrimispora sp.]|jgi:monofunctional glycosyltransferase|uniref:biosynthetic peptidoglycan transglycosylase n=1 Tax=Lacrimispora sp. TaxID=2719234 RepID=UPI0028AD4EBC|nr:biosynthetic peptidoglycan transglycosylase [Lacrimispora sp.]